MTKEQREWSQREHHDYKKRLGLSITHVPDSEYLVAAGTGEPAKDNSITGVHTYDILRNPLYAERFAYISMYLPTGYHRSKINLDGDDDDFNNEGQSDLVRLALFLPFMSKEDQDSFRFSIAWWEDHYADRPWTTHRANDADTFASCAITNEEVVA